MKKLVLLLIVTISVSAMAQSGNAALYIGEYLDFDDGITLEMVDVVDARCPNGATCIIPGSAKVTVAVFQEGQHIEDRVLTFHASGINSRADLLMDFGAFSIEGLRLLPYPSMGSKTSKQDYFLDLSVR